MFENHAFWSVIAGKQPMTALELELDTIRENLDRVRAEVDRLKAKADACGTRRSSRFARYLDRIDEKRRQVSDRLDALEASGGDAWGEVRQDLKEAEQRLAIAKLAASSRFH